MSVKYNGKHLAKFIRPEEYDTIFPQVELAHQQLESRSGAVLIGYYMLCRYFYII